MEKRSIDSSRDALPSSTSAKDGDEQFMIEIERPGEKLDMSVIIKMLESTGVKLDTSYGPFCINPKLGRFLVRGEASPEAQERVKKIPGVRLFRDTKIQPI